MTYNISPSEDVQEDGGFSSREAEGVSRNMAGLSHEGPKVPAARHRRAAAGGDGIKAFMMNFADATRSADAPPATKDFLKAASFLLRK